MAKKEINIFSISSITTKDIKFPFPNGKLYFRKFSQQNI